MILECFGKGLNSDIILVASGLLSGYDYHQYPKLAARRNKFLEDSNYLQNYPISKKAKETTISKNEESEENEGFLLDLDDITDYNDLNKEGKKICQKNLQAEEDKCFAILAEFLSKQNICNRLSENNSLNDKYSWGEGFPFPSYPTPNYEKLIWLELKKTNRKWHLPRLGGIVNKKNVEKALLFLCVVFLATSLFNVRVFVGNTRQTNNMPQGEMIEKIPLSPFAYLDINIDEFKRRTLNESRVILTNNDEIINQSEEGILRVSSFQSMQSIEDDFSLRASKDESLLSHPER